MTNLEAPLRKVEDALDRGFHTVDVRSDPTGVEVELRRGTEREVVYLDRDEAREVLAGDPVTVPSSRF